MEINLKDFQRIKILRGIEIIKIVENVERKGISILSVLAKRERKQGIVELYGEGSTEIKKFSKNIYHLNGFGDIKDKSCM